MDGAAGNDDLTGGAGADLMDAGAGNDILRIVGGDDLLTDTFIGGVGSDDLVNDSGADFAVTGWDNTGAGNGSGIEEIFFGDFQMQGTEGGNIFNFTGVGFQEITSGETQVATGGGDDSVTATSVLGRTAAGQNVFEIGYDLGAGSDVFQGGTSSTLRNRVDAGAGDDDLTGGTGAGHALGRRGRRHDGRRGGQ